MNEPGAIVRARKQPILNPRRGYRKGLRKLGANVRGPFKDNPTFIGKPSRKRPSIHLRSSIPAWAGAGLWGPLQDDPSCRLSMDN